jgi:hypothetical protein
MWMTEIGTILATDFTEMGFKVATRELPWILGYVGSWFKSDIAFLMKGWNIDYQFVNTESRDVLGIEYSIPME